VVPMRRDLPPPAASLVTHTLQSRTHPPNPPRVWDCPSWLSRIAEQQRPVPLRQHLMLIRDIHRSDLKEGWGAVVMPHALNRKYPSASREWGRPHWTGPAGAPTSRRPAVHHEAGRTTPGREALIAALAANGHHPTRTHELPHQSEMPLASRRCCSPACPRRLNDDNPRRGMAARPLCRSADKRRSRRVPQALPASGLTTVLHRPKLDEEAERARARNPQAIAGYPIPGDTCEALLAAPERLG